MTPPRPLRTDRAERVIAAPAGRVFSCWTDPALLVHWLPPRGMTGRVERFEAHPGGPFRIVLTHEDKQRSGKSGAGQDVVAGQFVAVDPPRHLAFVCRFQSDDPALQGQMRMDWTFDPVTAGTWVRVVASNVPPGISAGDHVAGMASSLTQLAALLE